jgi:ppGpp synthetase/RelA/SpoT-type nucleotidyltranferase
VDEVAFALRKALAAADVKVHEVTGRAKSLESLREKANRKGYDSPLEQAEDLAGVRVVALFLSDLSEIHSIVESQLNILSTKDTIDSDDASSFGYMSKHYIGVLNDAYTGPRYDEVKDLKVEVQVRTILMDAWANVSHYLAYKSDRAIPKELRREFSALSGLFYVADRQFESLVSASREVEQRARGELISEHAPRGDLNLETLSAYLARAFPDRKQPDRGDLGELVDQLLRAGYTTLDRVDEALKRGATAFETYESQRPPGGGGRYWQTGVVRVTLGIVDEAFNALVYERAGAQAHRPYRQYVSYAPPP